MRFATAARLRITCGMQAACDDRLVIGLHEIDGAVHSADAP
jgi:hypothetical protein